MKPCCVERMTAADAAFGGGSAPPGTTFLCVVCGAAWRKDWPYRWTQISVGVSISPAAPTPVPALPSVWDSPPPASAEGPKWWERLVSVAEPGYVAIELHECVQNPPYPWGRGDFTWRLHSRRLVEWPPKRTT